MKRTHATAINVGFAWESVDGTRKVIQIDESRGIAAVQTGDNRFPQVMRLADIPNEIKFDTKQLEQRQKGRRAAEEREAKEAAEKAAREDTHGFAEQFGAMRRQKILDALLKQRSYKGQFMPVKELVEQLYREGYQVKPHSKFKLIAESPDGSSFWTQRDLTKTAIDYLRYLQDKHVKAAAKERTMNDKTKRQIVAALIRADRRDLAQLFVRRTRVRAEKDVRKEIMQFFKENPNPPDSEVHKLAEDLGIDPHKLETVIYSILSELLSKQ